MTRKGKRGAIGRTVIRYKVLTRVGVSAFHVKHRIRYPLPTKGRSGEWITVPGKGAFVCAEGGPFGFGKPGTLYAEVECQERLGPAMADRRTGFESYRRVRLRRILGSENLPEASLARWLCNTGRSPSPLPLRVRLQRLIRVPAQQRFWHRLAWKELAQLLGKNGFRLVQRATSQTEREKILVRWIDNHKAELRKRDASAIYRGERVL